MVAALLLILPLSPIAHDRCDLVEVNANETTPLFQQRGLTTCSAKENEMAEMIVDNVKFRSIPDNPGYWVGENGCVASQKVVRKKTARIDESRWRVLRSGRTKHGYHTVALNRKSHYVHRLVAAAFVSEEISGLDVRHMDGTRDNNAASNLRIGTRAENEADKTMHGTRLIGESHPRAKLSNQQVMDIKTRRAAGESSISLASEYGIKRGTVNVIVSGKNWRHLHGK